MDSPESRHERPEPFLDDDFDGPPADPTSVALPLTAQAVFFAWEKLRLAYNLLLAVVTVALATAHRIVDRPDFWFYGFQGAFAANVGFCVGPVAEGYLCWLGLDRLVARTGLFVLGTLFAVALADWSIQAGYLSAPLP
jgi:hypothetical protein